MRLASAAFGLAALLALAAAPQAHAQGSLFRAYLSPAGSDANPCTLAQPCRLLPAALAAVADGGEVWMLESANYNVATVTIGKSVTILAVPGTIGSIVAPAGAALLVNTAGLKVTLRNLVIVPLPGVTGTLGVHVSAASTIWIEQSTVANHTGYGVRAETVGATVSVEHSTFRNNAFGLWILGGTGAVANSTFLGNTTAVVALGGSPTTTIALTESTISGGTTGVECTTLASSGGCRVTLNRAAIHHTQTPVIVYANTGATSAIGLGATTIAHNSIGWQVNTSGGGTVLIQTWGNNQIAYNGTSFGTLSAIGLQ